MGGPDQHGVAAFQILIPPVLTRLVRCKRLQWPWNHAAFGNETRASEHLRCAVGWFELV
jgi:hypothetical protein